MKRVELILVLVFAYLVIWSGELLPQAYQVPEAERNQASRYFLDTQDQVLLPVNILGLVDKPGQYMVPYRTDLITLIAFAGGFREDAKISKVKIIRNVKANGQNGHSRTKSRSMVFQVDLKRYFEKGDPNQIPQLMPDDTVLVTGSTTRTVNKIFSFVSKGMMLAQLYFLIKVANDR